MKELQLGDFKENKIVDEKSGKITGGAWRTSLNGGYINGYPAGPWKWDYKPRPKPDL